MVGQIECLIVASRDVSDFAPLTLLGGLVLFQCYWCDSESIGRPGHQVGDYALVGFPLINLPELLSIVDFDSDPILKHVLQGHFGLADVRWMTPCDLYRC